MRKTIYLAVLGFFTLSAAMADPVTLTLTPGNGSASGLPGTTVGWGYSITNNSSDYLVLANSYFCGAGQDPIFTTCTQSLGTYNDRIAQNFQNNLTVIAPGTTVSDMFDAGSGNGLGEYLIDALANPGQTDIGSIVIVYDAFDANPFLGAANQIGGDTDLSANAEVQVAGRTTVPEPGTLSLLSLALVGSGCLVRWKARLSSRGD